MYETCCYVLFGQSSSFTAFLMVRSSAVMPLYTDKKGLVSMEATLRSSKQEQDSSTRNSNRLRSDTNFVLQIHSCMVLQQDIHGSCLSELCCPHQRGVSILHQEGRTNASQRLARHQPESIITLFCKSTSAPCVSNTPTTSACPRCAAHMSAVDPLCSHTSQIPMPDIA